MSGTVEAHDKYRLRQLAADLWVVEAPLRFFGLPLGTRMTVVRLPSSGLVLHSPVAPTDELCRAVRALGTVHYLIAPNLYHHLFAGDWLQRFPDAQLYATPGLERKRPDLSITASLGSDTNEEWAAVLDQTSLVGMPALNESVFFHRPSRTLIATDLAFNIGASDPLLTRAAFWLLGAHGKLAPTLLERFQVKDRDGFRDALEQVLAWPFERVIVAHGAVVERGGKTQLADGYAWLRASPEQQVTDRAGSG